MKTIRGSFLLLAAVLLAVAAFTSTASARGRSKYPPCTRKALNAGLKRGSARQRNAKVERPFRCDRRWAYSAIVVGHGQSSFEAVAVYKARHGVWMTVNRARPCRTHAIPKKIYRGACTTS